MDEIIKTDNISRYFRKVKAVERISLCIRKGEIFGFLGLNGAGKTTTIRMLLGMISPTSGRAFLKGSEVNPGKTGLWKDIGYLVEIPYSYPGLTVRENLEIVRRMRFISDRTSVTRVIDTLKLNAYAERKAKHLSSGNAQRLGLAKALIHNPEILIMDEPSNALDPAGIVEIRELLKDLAFNHGVTIFVSSHILGEISKLATRIGIIHQGHLLQEMDTDELKQLLQRRLLISTLDNKAAKSMLLKQGYPVTGSDQGILEIKSEQATNHPEIIASILVHAGLPPTLLKVDEEDLESYFLRIINRNGEF